MANSKRKKTSGYFVTVGTGEKIHYNSNPTRSKPKVTETQKQAAEARVQQYRSAAKENASAQSGLSKPAKITSDVSGEAWTRATPSQTTLTQDQQKKHTEIQLKTYQTQLDQANRDAYDWGIREEQEFLGGFVPQDVLDRTNKSKYKSSAEAKQAAQVLGQQKTSLLNQNYENRSQNILKTVNADKNASSALKTAQGLEDLQRQIRYELEWSSAEGIDRSSAETRKLGLQYGLTEAECKNIWSMQAAITKKLKQAKAAVEKTGVSYDDAYEYLRRQELSQEAASKKTALEKELDDNGLEMAKHTGLSVLANMGKGVDYVAGIAGNWGHNDERNLDTYRPMNSDAMSATNYVNTVRGKVGSEIQEGATAGLKKLGASEGVAQFGGEASKFLYDTGMSIVDNAAQMAVAGVAGAGTAGTSAIVSGFMGTGAAADQMKNILDNGGTNDQAMVGGFAAGVAEALFEKVSIDALLTPKNITNFKSWAKEALKQGGVEASEEVCTELANMFTDALIRGQDSDFQRAIAYYQTEEGGGLSPAEAKKKAYLDAIGQVALAGLGGFISGGVMQGVKGGVGLGSYNSALKKVGQAVKDSTGNTQNTSHIAEIQKGLAAADGSKARQLAEQAQKELDSKKTVSSKLLGELAVENQNELRDAMKAASPEAAAKARTELISTGNVSTATMAELRASAKVSPAASAQVQQTEAQAQVMQAENPGVNVLDAATTLFTQQGMKLKTAQEKAAIVQKLIAGEEVSVRDINKLNPTSKEGQAIFTQLTGVQFPEGKVTQEQLYNLYRSAHDVAVQAQVQAQVQAFPGVNQVLDNSGQETPVNQMSEEQILEQAKAVRETANPEADARAAQALAQMRGEIAPDGNALLSFKEFSDFIKQQNPKATREETARLYDQYLKDNQTVEYRGQRLSHMQFMDMVRNAPTGSELTEAEAEGLWAAEVDRQRGAGEEKYSVSESQRTRESEMNAAAEQARRAENGATAKWMRDVLRPVGVQDVVVEYGTMAKNENAYIDGNGTLHFNGDRMDGTNAMVWTLGHELVHHAEFRTGETGNVSEDIIDAFSKLNKAGALSGIAKTWMDNVDGRVSELKKTYQDHEASLEDGDPDKVTDAYCREELAGDLMRIAFTEDNLLMSLAGEKPSLLIRSKEALARLKAQMFGNEQIRATVDARKALDEMEKRFEKALSSEKAKRRIAVEKVGVDVDEKSESASPARYNLDTWEKSDYVSDRDTAAKELAKELEVSEEQAKAYIDAVNNIAKMIADDKVRLDYEASPGRSAFVGNAEYGGSIDFSTICKKRRLFTGTFEAVQNALPNTALTAEEILDLRKRMKDKGYEVSCGLCYVEGSRANMGQYTKQFIERYAATNPEYVPNMAEMNTPDGQEKIRREHPEVYEAYEYFMNHYGRLAPGDKAIFASQQKPKMYQMATAYDGEILKKFRNGKSVDEKNKNGGLRLQSFSDFEIIHLIDNMQVIMDMARVGLAGQAYTKVPDFAWALGDTGLKINLSLIAKDVDENGNLVLDEVEGMKRADAVSLRDRYSDNVGTIIVVFNDAQLKAAMADDFIDYIIPFHRSQWKSSQYEAMGLPANPTDYTNSQNESYIEARYTEKSDGSKKKERASNYMPNTYWDFNKTGKENAETYLKMCAKDGKRPKFSHLLEYNGDGSYSLPVDGSADGYWKLLIDFKMYNNAGVGVPQKPVSPNFNMEQAQRMLNEYTGGHSSFPVARDVADEFVKDYKAAHPGARYSVEAKTDDRSQNYTYDALVSKPDITVTRVPMREVPTKGKRLDVSKIGSDGRNRATELTNDLFGNQRYTEIPDIGANVLITQESARHGLTGNKTNSSALNTAEVTYALPEVLRNSVAVNELNPRGKADGEYSYVLFGMAEREDGKQYLVKSTVNHFSDNKSVVESVEIYDILKGIKARKTKDPTRGSHTVNTAASLPSGALSENQTDSASRKNHALTDNGLTSTISVSQLLDVVKENYPELLPDSVREHYGITEPEKAPGVRYSITGENNAVENERAIRKLENEIEDINSKLDLASVDGLSEIEVRRLQNQLTKSQYELDQRNAAERKAAVRTPLQTVLDNLDNYRAIDLESIANQLTDNVWDDVETLSTEELKSGIREIIQERAGDMSPLEMQSPKFGVYVRKPSTSAGVRYSITPEFEQWYLEGFTDQNDRDRVKQEIEDLRTKYGTVPAGENPTREVNLPRKIDEKTRVHDTARTVMEAEATPKKRLADIQKAVLDGKLADVPVKNDVVSRRARARVDKNGWQTSLTDWTAKVRAGETSADLVAEGAVLLNNAGNSDMSGEQYVELLTDYSNLMHRTGQSLQAARILKTLSPEGRLYGIQKTVDQLNDNNRAKAEKKKGFDPAAWAEQNEIKLDPALVDAYRNAKTDTERDFLLGQIQQNIADQMPASLAEKLNNWRYLAMLGNFRTQIRNVLGNFFFQIPREVKETVAGGIEGALEKAGVKIDRTRSVVRDNATYKAAMKDFDSVRDIILNGGKVNEKMSYLNGIDSKRRIYKNKVLEGYRRVVNTAMDSGDAVFCKFTYADSLARFMAANHTTWDTAPETLREKGRLLAIKEAAEATYRDNNAFSEMVLSMRFKNPGSNKAKKAVNAVVEGILPFRKTPANILVRGVEYSPLGLVKTAVDTVSAAKGSRNVTGSDLVNEFAKSLTGSGLFALGYFLTKMGVLTALGPDDDDKEKEFWELQGNQSYSINLFGRSYTIDWLAPEAIPLLVGANTAEIAAEEGLDLNAVTKAATRITDPMLEMSMLQGVNSLIENIANTKTVAALPSLVLNSLWSYGLQYVPTLTGQLNRAMDNTRRTTYTDATSGVPTGVQYSLGKLSQKVPGWSYNQIPYIDQWGRMEENYESKPGNAFAQFLSPAYQSIPETSDMERELQRLYDATGETGVLPSKAPKYLTVDGERRDLTAEEYVNYATLRGQTAYDMLTDLTGSSVYRKMSDKDKVKAVGEIYSYAADLAKQDLLGGETKGTTQKAVNADSYGISSAEYAALKTQTAGIESLKYKNQTDADGKPKTIQNSQGLQIMESVYSAYPNLTKKQYEALFEALGVGKTVRGYSKQMVQNKLKQMRRQAAK